MGGFAFERNRLYGMRNNVFLTLRYFCVKLMFVYMYLYVWLCIEFTQLQYTRKSSDYFSILFCSSGWNAKINVHIHGYVTHNVHYHGHVTHDVHVYGTATWPPTRLTRNGIVVQILIVQKIASIVSSICRPYLDTKKSQFCFQNKVKVVGLINLVMHAASLTNLKESGQVTVTVAITVTVTVQAVTVAVAVPVTVTVTVFVSSTCAGNSESPTCNETH
jgi:hypothetical protein